MGRPYSKEYLRGFLGTLAKYAAAGVRPSQYLPVRQMPGRGTYISAAPAKAAQPRHAIRAYDPSARYKPPAWSAEGRLNDAATTAVKATPAVLSAPVAATVGGLNGVAGGVHDRNGFMGTALRGMVGAGTAFIPGGAGLTNSATGAIESAVGGALKRI